MTTEIVMHAYQPHWPDEFEALRADLQAVLGALALRIDHIGSTAVPGLGAKDVIDVQITVAILSEEIDAKMEAAGYQPVSPAQDHIPCGMDPNPALWEKRLFVQKPGARRANIHVRVAGNPNQQYALLFRDYLRAHPHSAETLELIKREIAKRHAHDVETYYAIKDPIYDLIWVAAQEWAKFNA